MEIDVEALSDEELRDELTAWAGRVAAGDAVVLQLVGELDAREAWAGHGVLSCAHWVAWRLGLTVATGQDRVRVARQLRSLPRTAEAFAAGQLSYSQVRAIGRVATASDEQTWVELGRHCTAEQLEQAARGAARVRKNAQRRTDPQTAATKDAVRVRWDDDGDLVLTMRIAAEHAPAVLAAIEQGQREEQAERDAGLATLATEVAAGLSAESREDSSEGPEAGPTAEGDAATDARSGAELSAGSHDDTVLSWAGPVPEPYEYEEPPYPLPASRSAFEPLSESEKQALAGFLAESRARRAKARAWQEYQQHVARQAAARELPSDTATLADGLIRALTRPGEAKVKVQVLVDPLSRWGRTVDGELLPPSTLRRMRAPVPVEWCALDRGRASRDVTPALRTLLGRVDGERCRMPGCSRKRNLHAHHVVFWSDGGRTDLSNLVLVCSRHHTLIHRDGYQLTLRPDRTLEVRTADGLLLEHHPALPVGDAAELDRRITPETLPTQWTGERMDLGFVVNVMLQHAA